MANAAGRSTGGRQVVTAIDRTRWSWQIWQWREVDKPAKPWRWIAAETGFTVRGCEKMLERLKQSGLAHGAQPEEHIRRHLMVLSEAMRLAAETYEAAEPGSPVRIGAIRQMREAAAEERELLQQIGELPAHLGMVNFVREAQVVFRSVMEVLERHGVSDDVLAELALLGDRLRPRRAIEERAISA
jgi:hypothetical protein